MSDAIEYTVDRSGWGHGPWDGEPDRVQWRTEAGLPGLIVRNTLGTLCGYVAVPPGHTLHGLHYDHEQVSVDVHGGLTYSDSCQGPICHAPRPGEPDNVWWFGFDCAHLGDGTPFMIGKFGSDLGRYYADQYRDIGYVRREVERLAKQLK